MPFKYQPNVPERFAEAMRKFTKAECVEVMWDLFVQSPWFDETSAWQDVPSVIEKAVELRSCYRELRA